MDEVTHTKWKINNIVRDRESGHPYLVLHASKYYCTVCDLQANSVLVPALTILQRDFDKYTLDTNMASKEISKNRVKYEYSPHLVPAI